MKKIFQVLFLSLLCYACGSSEKQQLPKDYIEIDMVPLIEGSVAAAKFLAGKPAGMYNMKSMLAE